jgi:hypothetical protein
MAQKKSASKKTASRTRTGNSGEIWVAAGHIGEKTKQGALTPAMRKGVAPFMMAAVDLALATVSDAKEDTTAILERARLALEAAIETLPSLADCLDAPVKAKKQLWQRTLARYAVWIARDFRP